MNGDPHAVGAAALSSLAYERKDASAYRQWQKLGEAERRGALENKHVMLSVARHVTTFLPAVGSADAGRFKASFQQTVRDVADNIAREGRSLGAEWFEGLGIWVAYLIRDGEFQWAEELLDLAFARGVNRFPAIRQGFVSSRVEVDVLTRGGTGFARTEGASFALRPYLIPRLKTRAALYRLLMPVLLRSARMAEYRGLLWRGVSEFYFDDALRSWFVQQARTTYRGNLRALLRAEVALRFRFGLAGLQLWASMNKVRLARRLRLTRLLRLFSHGYLYFLNYSRAERAYLPNVSAVSNNKILVTRAMGGLGDLLAMTPGLRALRAKSGGEKINLAVPPSFFPLFRANDDVECIDIESEAALPSRYGRWYDLTDCPAARREALEMPNVRTNRIEAFAAGMGIRKAGLRKYGFRPRYEITQDEAQEAGAYLALRNPERRYVIGVQPFAAETYRDWPHAAELTRQLARQNVVLVFHHEPLEGFTGENVHQVDYPLRKSFAIAAQCNLLVAPDSVFVHLAAALDIPVVAIYGPTGGKVITRHYPNATVVLPEETDFPCSPCYRNEEINCGLARSRQSVCMPSIATRQILDVVTSHKAAHRDQ
jgi:ADP-heptose:LPS heptosyltransferase